MQRLARTRAPGMDGGSTPSATALPRHAGHCTHLTRSALVVCGRHPSAIRPSATIGCGPGGARVPRRPRAPARPVAHAQQTPGGCRVAGWMCAGLRPARKRLRPSDASERPAPCGDAGICRTAKPFKTLEPAPCRKHNGRQGNHTLRILDNGPAPIPPGVAVPRRRTWLEEVPRHIGRPRWCVRPRLPARAVGARGFSLPRRLRCSPLRPGHSLPCPAA